MVTTVHSPRSSLPVLYLECQSPLQITDKSQDFSYRVEFSILEIYNEEIKDLLEPGGNKKLEVRQGPDGNYVQDLYLAQVVSSTTPSSSLSSSPQHSCSLPFFLPLLLPQRLLPSLSCLQVSSYDEVIKLWSKARENRSLSSALTFPSLLYSPPMVLPSPHRPCPKPSSSQSSIFLFVPPGCSLPCRTTFSNNINEHSSRSHLVLSVYARGENRSTGVQSYGKLHLVDLAGPFLRSPTPKNTPHASSAPLLASSLSFSPTSVLSFPLLTCVFRF
eukprot:766182-Hanusia_phi.AAC.2